jgi:hypothetical protein
VTFVAGKESTPTLIRPLSRGHGSHPDNNQEQERRHRDPVMYGQVVQLWHPALQGYLQVSTTTTSQMEPK